VLLKGRLWTGGRAHPNKDFSLPFLVSDEKNRRGWKLPSLDRRFCFQLQYQPLGIVHRGTRFFNVPLVTRRGRDRAAGMGWFAEGISAGGTGLAAFRYLRAAFCALH
jgi:hypothetical protein